MKERILIRAVTLLSVWSLGVDFYLGVIGLQLISVVGLLGIALILAPTVYSLRQKEQEVKKGGTISWLDYMRIRDLMSHGQNYEAVSFTLKRGYNMTDAEITALTPEKLDELMTKLKVKAEGEK